MNELRGVGVALATPLHSDYTVDFMALERLVKHVADKSDFFVVMGSTGEAPVFSWEEQLEILAFVSKVSAQKPLVLGLTSNHTFDLIEKAQSLKELPLHAVLSAAPYYSRPSQHGINRHFEMLADACPHPVILYNVPARTASNITAETTLALAQHENIVGIKESSGDLQQCDALLSHRPEGFMLWSGEDHLTLELTKSGAEGAISVVANVHPQSFHDMVHAALSKDNSKAEKLDNELKAYYALASSEGNPTSIKGGLEALGLCGRTVKPPLYDASDESVAAWKALLSK